MSFSISSTDSSCSARRGAIQTSRGVIQTPAFMPVGTQGTVKAVSPEELENLGADIILGNTYHLFLRPGTDIIKSAGGLHKFCGWEKPILTDSGGFQVFSLSKLRKITPEGVEFSSHIDGSTFFLGPKESIRIQRDLDADIIMAFDECTPYPCSYEEAEKSMRVTAEWEKISRDEKIGKDQKIFGIVQGSVYKDLREESAKGIVSLDFDGYAIGGLSVGEPEEKMFECIDWTAPLLPADKPRYLMGAGLPRQIVEAVARGIDMFDCVIPTRLARHGSAFVHGGESIPVKAGRYSKDLTPIDSNCSCYACRKFSKAYIRHLINVGEILGIRLLTLHNLHYYLNLMREIRESITNGTFDELRDFYSKTQVAPDTAVT